jgi:hypothetical protein
MSAPRKRTSPRHAIGMLCLLIACSLAVSVAGGHVGATDTDSVAKRGRVLSVKGHAEGLYPGASVPLPVRIRNRSPHELMIRKIKVRAGAPGAACSGAYVSARAPKPTRIRMRPHSNARAALSLRMLLDAPDACQGATIPLRFKVRARRP